MVPEGSHMVERSSKAIEHDTKTGETAPTLYKSVSTTTLSKEVSEFLE